uniref:Putative enoyl-CoA hydratase 1 n=1 Tax=Sym plasmid TaxID=28430 RepID=A0A515HIF8_9ZZZZ|nr:putative enoyl-CoA hydratase 1 [Sym plasmid]
MRNGAKRRHSPPPTSVALLGGEFVRSRCIEIDQPMIDRFGIPTNDHNWLTSSRNGLRSPPWAAPSRTASSPCICLLLWHAKCCRGGGAKMSMNYGLNTTRLVAPVTMGSRIRGAFALNGEKTKEDGSCT